MPGHDTYARDVASPFLLDAGGDVAIAPLDLETAAVAAEQAGYDGVIAPETQHDPFVALALVARATERITLTTGIAVAFARNPMTTAMAANDIQLISQGRLILGLGSQVKAHIERRFSMPWSQPAARMREYVEAVRAIWEAWQTGERLKFQGEFYSHTLMSPFFDPGPNPHGTPPIWIAAVGEGMAETAGRVADGVIGHGFTTRRYLTEVSLPAVKRGQDAAGREAGSVGYSVSPFVAIGGDQKTLDAAVAAVRAPDRVLRVDPRVPRRDGAARLGGDRRPAARAVDPRRLEGDGRAHLRRDARRVRRGRHRERGRGDAARAVRRARDADVVLRALQDRPGRVWPDVLAAVRG